MPIDTSRPPPRPGATTSSPRPAAAPPRTSGPSAPAATGFSGSSAFEGAASEVLTNLGEALANKVFGDDDDAPQPSWAKAPRAPNGEGVFEGKSAQEIADMGFDAIKNASPRELYALRARQLPGADAVLGDQFNTLSKGQRRAYLRAKIAAGIFSDVVGMMGKYNRIAG